MPVSEILQRLQKRAQTTHVPVKKETLRPNPGPAARSSANTERVVDPVVARLKAARRRENEERERQRMEKKGPSAKASKARAKPVSKPASKPVAKPAPRNAPKGQTPVAIRQNPIKKPKMSFNELMKKASGIDQLKMSINIKSKVKSPDPHVRGRSAEPKRQEKKAVSLDRHRKPAQPEKAASRAPIPIRKPSSHLEERLKKTKQAEDSGSDDMSSFIESDDEGGYEQQDYDRDEIWSIFNKGRKRSYYEGADDESDDMEATGAEILEEEMRSKRNALEEDRREMEEEARLAALKKARRGK